MQEDTFKILKFNDSLKILTPKTSFFIKKYDLEISTEDYEFFKEEKVLLNEKEIEIFEEENKEKIEFFKIKNRKGKFFMQKEIYLKKMYELFIKKDLKNTNTEIKYFKKKIQKKLKSVLILELDSFSYHKVMRQKYLQQINHFTEEGLAYMTLFFDKTQNTCVIDDVKGILSLHFSSIENLEKNTDFYSTKKKNFEYRKGIKFENFKISKFAKIYDTVFMAGNFNKIKFIEKINAKRFILFFQFQEVHEISQYLFQNVDKFTDISIKELMGREIEIKCYDEVFMHPQITSTIGKGFVASFVKIEK